MTVTPRVFLLDVEGTVSPISLVSEQLFPYARAHFSGFLQTHSGDPAVQSDLGLLFRENRAETGPDVPRIPAQDSRGSSSPLGSREGVESSTDSLAYLFWLMDRDRKSTALKSLQGKIWKAGFESGELKGTLFPDVPAALLRWSAQNRIAIYSSGSTSAQQLLFRCSTFGNLTAFIAAYFDTRTGVKIAPGSYTAIAAEMQVEPRQVCFFSDVVRELDPAREAGLATRLVAREGNATVEDTHGHLVVESFSGCF